MPKHSALSDEEHVALMKKNFPDYTCAGCTTVCRNYAKCARWVEWLRSVWPKFKK